MHTIELLVTIKILIINSQILHDLKYKVFAFDRKPPSVSAKLSVTHAEHLGQFRLL